MRKFGYRGMSLSTFSKRDSQCWPLRKAPGSPCWPPRKREVNRIADDMRLTVVGVNYEYIDMFELWHGNTVKKLSTRNLVIVCLDEPAYHVLAAKFPERTFLPSFVNGTIFNNTAFGNDAFIETVSTRPQFVLSFLEEGYDVFYVDIDTIIVRNPYPVFVERLLTEKADIVMGDDTAGMQPGEGNICTGIFYVRSCASGLELMKRWQDKIRVTRIVDQFAFNAVISEMKQENNSLRLSLLDKGGFPNGHNIMSGDYNWSIYPEGPFMVHANYLVGHDAKMSMLTITLPKFLEMTSRNGNVSK